MNGRNKNGTNGGRKEEKMKEGRTKERISSEQTKERKNNKRSEATIYQLKQGRKEGRKRSKDVVREKRENF